MPVLLEQTAANDPKPILMTGDEVPKGTEGRGVAWPLLVNLSNHQLPMLFKWGQQKELPNS